MQLEELRVLTKATVLAARSLNISAKQLGKLLGQPLSKIEAFDAHLDILPEDEATCSKSIQLIELDNRLLEVCGEDVACIWLHAQNAAFNGDAPMDIMLGGGIEKVQDYLACFSKT